LSGGLDSSTCLALARRDGFACYALTFDYGQRHKFELEAAARVAAGAGRRAASGGESRPRRVRRIGADGDVAVPKARSTK
jgi:7-cyano-7-deazaguanine synthase